MTDSERVPVAKAKGRPMLSWVGKRPLREVRAFPSQLVERFAPETPAGVTADDVDWSEWPDRFDRGGLLFHGDNKEVLAHLLASGFRGKVDLVYIDPPFDSGADYVRKVQLRGASGSARLDGETYTLGEQIQYTDIWANDTYLQFMYERLLLIKELMAKDSAVYLHADTNRNYMLRSVLDEVFGADAYVNEVVWRRADAHNDPNRFGAIHDTIYYYAVGERHWNTPTVPLISAKLETDAHYVWDPARQQYFRLGDLRGPGDRGPRYTFKGVDRHWKWSRAKLAEDSRSKRMTLIETRGEGGYVVIAPSNGTVHPEGGAWTLEAGGFDSIVTITDDERDALFDVARMLDTMPVAEARQPRGPAIAELCLLGFEFLHGDVAGIPHPKVTTTEAEQVSVAWQLGIGRYGVQHPAPVPARLPDFHEGPGLWPRNCATGLQEARRRGTRAAGRRLRDTGRRRRRSPGWPSLARCTAFSSP